MKLAIARLSSHSLWMKRTASLLALACCVQIASAQFTGKLVYEVSSPAPSKLTMIYYQNGTNARIEAFYSPKSGVSDPSKIKTQDTLLFDFGKRTATHLQYKTGMAVITKYTLDIMATNPGLQGGNVTVQNLGPETVNGYSCTHYALVRENGVAPKGSKTEVWITAALGAPTIYVMGNFLYYTPGYPPFTKLLEAGGNGVVVKILYGFTGYMSTINLVSVDKTTPSSSFFKIPSYYRTIDNSNFTMPANH